MIMLLTHQEELTRQLAHALHLSGHQVAIPRNREEMLTVLKNSQPELVIFNLHTLDPIAVENLRLVHDHEYVGAVLVLSGPSMTPIVNVVYASGLRVTRVVQAPDDINGHYDFWDLELNIQTLLDEVEKRKRCHASIARRAHEIYEVEGKREGHHVQNWLRAEQELSSRLGTRIGTS